jgi:hypothetical protein
VAWYWWVLLWAVLILGSAGVLALLGLSLWRRIKLLTRELATASERLSAVTEGLQEIAERTTEPAVFTPASQLRQERFLQGRRQDGRHSARRVPDPGHR